MHGMRTHTCMGVHTCAHMHAHMCVHTHRTHTCTTHMAGYGLPTADALARQGTSVEEFEERLRSAEGDRKELEWQAYTCMCACTHTYSHACMHMCTHICMQLVLATFCGAGSHLKDWRRRWRKLQLENDEAYARALDAQQNEEVERLRSENAKLKEQVRGSCRDLLAFGCSCYILCSSHVLQGLAEKPQATFGSPGAM